MSDPFAPLWTLAEAVDLAREMNAALAPLQYHTALTGGCLYRGESYKDVDIVIYPRSMVTRIAPDDIIRALAETFSITESRQAGGPRYPFDKIVFITTLRGKRCDLFFLS
jgi:hypothetical protein